MANDVSYIRIIDVRESKNPETGEIRLTAVAETILPRRFNLNLASQTSDVINTFKRFKGKSVMVQTRDGVVNGMPFTTLTSGLVIPVDESALASIGPQIDEDVDQLPDNPSPASVSEIKPEDKPEDKPAAPMFGRKSA